MTAGTTLPADAASSAARTAARSGNAVLPALAATLVSFLAQRAQLLAAWRDGAFFDTDDAMHMVQVRALLAGQGWYDMLVPRLDPPAGTVMHWAHLADVPTAALVRLFAVATNVATAERLACLALPFLQALALFLLVARLARLLLGPEAVLPALLGALLSGTGIMQFAPGRIDHHAPQILILLLALACLIESLDEGRARRALPAGLLAGLSLAINLEDMPFLAVLGAAIVALWVWWGEPMRRALGWHATGLGCGLPLGYVAITAPSLYGETVCDAYGLSHLGAGVIAAAGLAALAALPPAATRLRRGAAATVVAVAALGFVVLATPRCLSNPFAAVDPLVRRLWLADVAESLPLASLWRHDPATALAAALPVALGLAGCFAGCLAGFPALPQRDEPLRRRRFALVAAVVGAGLALSLWQVRVLASVGALAALGGACVCVAAKTVLLARGRPALASLSLALIFPFTAAASTQLVPSPTASAPDAFRADAPVASSSTGGGACLSPPAFAPLADWRGTVDAPLDAGSYLLAHTGLSAYAAAFHRDNDGNRFHFDLAMAGPAEAEGIARSRRLDFVMLCPGWPETRLLASRAPASLASALAAGRIPAWLERLPVAGTPIAVYRLRPASDADAPVPR